MELQVWVTHTEAVFSSHELDRGLEWGGGGGEGGEEGDLSR